MIRSLCIIVSLLCFAPSALAVGVQMQLYLYNYIRVNQGDCSYPKIYPYSYNPSNFFKFPDSLKPNGYNSGGADLLPGQDHLSFKIKIKTASDKNKFHLCKVSLHGNKPDESYVRYGDGAADIPPGPGDFCCAYIKRGQGKTPLPGGSSGSPAKPASGMKYLAYDIIVTRVNKNGNCRPPSN